MYNDEEKIAKEGLRNKHELVQHGDTMVMKHKGQHLELNDNDDKDFPHTFESYLRLIILLFSEDQKGLRGQNVHIDFSKYNKAIKKLKILLNVDIKNNEKLKYYVNIIESISIEVKDFEEKTKEFTRDQTLRDNILIMIRYMAKITDKLIEIDNDIKISYLNKNN